MRILSIDPGFERVGIAILEKENGKEILLYSTCFKTSPKTTFPERLVAVGNKVRDIITEYRPTLLAIETLFMTNNQKTGMHVAEARGVIVHEAARAGLTIVEYTPGEIKLAVTGYGKSDKTAVMSMVRKLIRVDSPTTSDDELDAIAIGLTAFACYR